MTGERVQLTVAEQEQVRQQALKAMHQRLDQTRPDLNAYIHAESKAAHWLTQILLWSKAFVPVIALFAALASAVRTVQTAAEIYTASGSHPVGVALAALAFTLAAEGALFVIALAQEGEHMKLRASGAPRHVLSLRHLLHAVQVRIGIREPWRHDEMQDGSGLWLVTMLAFLFAVAANAYMGFRPLLEEIGDVSLQGFFGTLWFAPAPLQLAFIVDAAGILFPPLMALAAGHLTARFAAEIAEQGQQARTAFEHDLAAWRAAYNNPLDTPEGALLLERYEQDRLRAKAARAARRKQSDSTDFFPHPLEG